MKAHHLDLRIAQCRQLAAVSCCPRNKVGAMILNPERNTVLSDGYNGGPRRAAGRLCGGETCDRDTLGIASGTRMEVGCHHAESNAIANAAADGVRTAGAWLIVTHEPCLMCAKLIHHAGITQVVCVSGAYKGGPAGPEYLERNGVPVRYLNTP